MLNDWSLLMLVPGLLHALVDLAAAPPPEPGLLPSRALTSDRLAPGIAAWAAAGALKNLALSRNPVRRGRLCRARPRPAARAVCAPCVQVLAPVVQEPSRVALP